MSQAIGHDAERPAAGLAGYATLLGVFARTEGQKGGEFYTHCTILRLLTEVIEPYHGRILDTACGSGGIFVQSTRFMAENKKKSAAALSINGGKKTVGIGRLSRMNPAVHRLEGKIRNGANVKSCYDDSHAAPWQSAFFFAA